MVPVHKTRTFKTASYLPIQDQAQQLQEQSMEMREQAKETKEEASEMKEQTAQLAGEMATLREELEIKMQKEFQEAIKQLSEVIIYCCSYCVLDGYNINEALTGLQV